MAPNGVAIVVTVGAIAERIGVAANCVAAVISIGAVPKRIRMTTHRVALVVAPRFITEGVSMPAYRSAVNIPATNGSDSIASASCLHPGGGRRHKQQDHE